MPLSPTQRKIQDFSTLTESMTWTEADSQLREMENLYRSIDHGSKEGIVLCFALAKAFDDLGETERCFELLIEGNRNHRHGKTDTLDEARATVATLREIFSTQTVNGLAGPLPHQPVFILGMPRSGTTLVEQILASHPGVYGAGELKLMGQWSYGFVKLYRSDPRNIQLDRYLPQLREHYLNGLVALGVKEKFITDKMPLNFLWVGFILAAFPDASIIHTRRDPMAVCWSLFKTDFAGTSNGYACDLGDIGEFYRLYAGLMEFWKQKYPGSIYDLDYQQLTVHQAQETRRLLDYCGLGWDDACLAFHRTDREVRTASKAQVRRPMYQGSSEAWKRYEKHLAPLVEALRPLRGESPGRPQTGADE
jgi:hypothetical protein